MQVANDANDTEEDTSIRADGGLTNLGLISLADVAAQTDVQDGDRFHIDSDYTGGGVVELNAYLGDADSSADTFNVHGYTTGVTRLRIVDTGVGGGEFVDEATGDGILIAHLDGGSEEDVQNIVLEGGTVNAGFFDYYLVESEDGTEFQLFSEANGSASEAAVAPSAAANVWHQTESAWEERQQVLRDATRRITAVSDVGISEDKGYGNLWLQAVGSKIDQDGSSTYDGLAFASGYEQTSLGLVGGLDMEAEFGGGSILFGVLAGYTSSDLDFSASSNSLDFAGFSLGGYATLLSNGFFTSALVKADFMDMTHRVNPGLEATTDVTSVGLRGDLGYRMGSGGFMFEPSVSLSHITTSIDGYDLGLSSFGGSNSSDTSVGAGIRTVFTGEQSSIALTARVWNDFGDNNSVEIDLAGLAPADAVDAGTFDGLYGELGADASFRFMESSILFAGARIKFDDEATSMSGNLGVNIAW
jgi:outer membrane autotransporter protein